MHLFCIVCPSASEYSCLKRRPLSYEYNNIYKITMAGARSPQALSIDFTASPNWSGWCEADSAPQKDCRGEQHFCPFSLPLWKGIFARAVYGTETSWLGETPVTKTPWKLWVPVGAGNPAPQRGLRAVSCPDRLHPSGVLKRFTLERHIYKAGYGQKQMQMY